MIFCGSTRFYFFRIQLCGLYNVPGNSLAGISCLHFPRVSCSDNASVGVYSEFFGFAMKNIISPWRANGKMEIYAWVRGWLFRLSGLLWIFYITCRYKSVGELSLSFDRMVVRKYGIPAP